MSLSSLTTFAGFVRSRPGVFLLLGALTVVVALLEMAGLTSVYLLVSSLVESATPGDVGRVLSLARTILRQVPLADPFTTSLVLFVSLQISLFLLSFGYQVLTQYAALRAQQDYHERLFDAYLTAEYQSILDRRQGDILYRLLLAPPLAAQLVTGALELLSYVFRLVAVIVLLLVSAPWVTLSVLVVGGLFLLGNEALGRRVAYDWAREKVLLRERQQALVSEAIDGIKPLKVYGQLDSWASRFRATMDAFVRLQDRVFIVTRLPARAFTVGSFAMLVLLIVVLKAVLRDQFSLYLPLMAVFFVALERLVPVLAGIARARMLVVDNLPAARLVEGELQALAPRPASGRRMLDSIGEGVRFSGVTIAYPGRGEILHGVSFLCRRGATTAIVGPSGAGKSSLLALLVRLRDPAGGRILVGGVDLRELETSAWLKRLGYVAQETFLLNASIAENIAFGRATTRSQIEEAARLAGAEEFIRALPNGFDTQVGDQGFKLSGGQRQRIGIARAILEQPEILVLDEPTSALDSQSEADVQASLARLSAERTIIVVAHRLSTIQDADHIVVIDGGRVIEEGTHDALIQERGLYFRLYSIQSQQQPEVLATTGPTS